MARIAFFGTPEFGATLFETLISYCKTQGHTTLFAVCQPDRPKGRGQSLSMPPVKTIALQNNIPVFQPSTLKAGTPEGDAFYDTLKDANLDLAVVVAYGHIIPKRMLALAKHGFINVHASLLPRFRGAAPIQRALLAGDAKTGVSIIDLTPEMDAGDVYAMAETPISPSDTAITLSERLATLGGTTLTTAINGILSGTLAKVPQPQEGLCFAPKLTKEEGSIPWDKSATDIINHERALIVWPQSFSTLSGRPVKLFGAHIPEQAVTSDASEGTILALAPALVVKCRGGAVAFDAVQFEGKSRLSIRDAVNGKLLSTGERFSTHPALA